MFLYGFVHVCECRYPQRPEASEPPELELWVVLSCWMSVLGTERQYTARAVHDLNH